MIAEKEFEVTVVGAERVLKVTEDKFDELNTLAPIFVTLPLNVTDVKLLFCQNTQFLISKLLPLNVTVSNAVLI